MQSNPYTPPGELIQPSSTEKLSAATWTGLIVLAFAVFAIAMEYLKP
jgi:hypothetical protein